MLFDLTSAAGERSNLHEMPASIFSWMERNDICAQENARVNKLAPFSAENHRIYILSKGTESQEVLIEHQTAFSSSLITNNITGFLDLYILHSNLISHIINTTSL